MTKLRNDTPTVEAVELQKSKLSPNAFFFTVVTTLYPLAFKYISTLLIYCYSFISCFIVVDYPFSLACHL